MPGYGEEIGIPGGSVGGNYGVPAPPQILAHNAAFSATSGATHVVPGASLTVDSSVGTWTTETDGFLVPQAGLYAISVALALPSVAIALAGVALTNALAPDFFYSNTATINNATYSSFVRAGATDHLGPEIEHFIGSTQNVGVYFKAVFVSV